MEILNFLLCFACHFQSSRNHLLTHYLGPFELVKTAQQLSADITKPGSGSHLDHAIRQSYDTKSSPQMAYALYKNRGFIGGLYCGYRFQLQRDTLATAVYFGSYETIKQTVNTIRQTPSTDKTAISIAAFSCGVLSFLSSYPLDTVRTRYQKNCLTSHIDRTKIPKMQIFSKSIWRGWWVGVARSGFVNLVLFLGFETFKGVINRLEISTLR